MTLSILYRGPLASCNYDCSYCPFAKHHSPQSELAADREGLGRFTSWVEGASEQEISVLFTPWGEALVRRWYREAMVRLSHLPHVRRVAIQTNLSGRTEWLKEANRDAIALWATFHPGEVAYEDFLERTHQLCALGVRFSVGIVGKREHLGSVERLRNDLPDDVYLWVNAYKSEGPGYYTDVEIERLTGVDPHFPDNNQRHASLGHVCAAGQNVISVDGDGTVRRCHFIAEPLGNLYADALSGILGPAPCSNATCGCHIGYVHLERLGLRSVYGQGILERIPEGWPGKSPRSLALVD